MNILPKPGDRVTCDSVKGAGTVESVYMSSGIWKATVVWAGGLRQQHRVKELHPKG